MIGRLWNIVCLSFSDNGGSRALSDTMSWGEFIELRDLQTSRAQIELTGTRSPCSPPRLERTNALRISPGKVPDLLSRVGIIRVQSSTQDPQLSEEKGEGHNFQPCSHAQPTWCDLCGDFIWGLYKQSLRCVSELAYVGWFCGWFCAYAWSEMSNTEGKRKFLKTKQDVITNVGAGSKYTAVTKYLTSS